MSSFGKRLRELRLSANKSMGELARHLEVSVPYVSDVENGKRGPFSGDKIIRTAEYLGIDPRELLKLSLQTRGYFELRASLPESEYAGTALLREWDSFSAADFVALTNFLKERKSGREP